ncbi:MAG: DUF6134 family protein [Gemmatimonadota bacterium]|nr:DUF6134 family protein [Gemmatimonadota bacterium]
MRTLCGSLCLLVATLVLATHTRAQGIVVDEGRFQVSVAGREVGSEEFSIRRAGIGREDAFFATGVITRGSSVDRQEIRPLLRASPPEGVAASYQVKVTGRDSLDFQMTLVGRRYVAVARSPRGDEEREFAAHEGTRVLDRDVAHHYYFLRDVREGEKVHVIEPRTRSQITFSVERRTEDEIQLAGRTTPARRIELHAPEETRIVWYDRLGRVLRVEIPALGYTAERLDLVG